MVRKTIRLDDDLYQQVVETGDADDTFSELCRDALIAYLERHDAAETTATHP